MSASLDHERAVAAPHFDADFYLAGNPDVARLGLDPLEHFLARGWREGRDPAPDFSVRSYLDLNPDVAEQQVNPFVHWLTNGEAEGRPTRFALGFRYDLLREAQSLEARLEFARQPPPPPGDVDSLIAALGVMTSERLFITVGQACLPHESESLRAAGWSHLHLQPAVPREVTDFETDDPAVGLVIDGAVAGAWSADHVAAQVAMMAHRGQVKRTAFAVHGLAGHNVTAVTGILQNAGARKGWFWLHVQSSLCASSALLRNDVAYCGGPPADSAACGVCVYGLRRQVQMAEHAAFFRAFDLTVVAPSEAMLEHWRARAPYDYHAALVTPPLRLRPLESAPTADGSRLRIAFLGAPETATGWPIFRQLAEQFGDRYDFLHLDEAELSRTVREHEVDVALLPAIAPQAFAYEAHQAVAGGAAVVALRDSLALAAFVEETAAGLVAETEAELAALVAGGGLEPLARNLRRPMLYALEPGRMTGDLLEPAR
jgi:hypothetical protein